MDVDISLHADPTTREGLKRLSDALRQKRNALLADQEAIREQIAHVNKRLDAICLLLEQDQADTDTTVVSAAARTALWNLRAGVNARAGVNVYRATLRDAVHTLIAEHPEWDANQVKERLLREGFDFGAKDAGRAVRMVFGSAKGTIKLGRPRKDSGKNNGTEAP